MVNIVKPHFPDFSLIAERLEEALSTGMVTNQGAHVRAFETALSQYLGSSAVARCFCNGEQALYALIQSWKRKLGYRTEDSFKVLVPSLTFSGTVNALVMANLEPVFCDVDQTLTIDVTKFPDKPTGVRMILAVGAYGNLPDVDGLQAYAEAHDLVLLFDNAPAFGSKYDSRSLTAQGFDEIYSFHATKGFSTMEGGAAFSSDADVSEYLVQCRDFGQVDKVVGDVIYPGLNGKMMEVSALIGLAALSNVNSMIDSRIEVGARYAQAFSCLKNAQIMEVRPQVSCNYLYFPLVVSPTAERFVEKMDASGIAVRRYYTAVHTLAYYRDRYNELDLSRTEKIMDHLVALPVHSFMASSDVEKVIETTKQVLGEL